MRFALRLYPFSKTGVDSKHSSELVRQYALENYFLYL